MFTHRLRRQLGHVREQQYLGKFNGATGTYAAHVATDFWTYISMGYFHQIPVAGEVGSSTMPHKVNPIRFENAEANLELSNALFGSLAQTLITSRMQRDLTDSTTQRNIGVAFGYTLLKGLTRGHRIGQADLEEFVQGLDIGDEAKQRLLALRPETYIGLAEKLAKTW